MSKRPLEGLADSLCNSDNNNSMTEEPVEKRRRSAVGRFARCPHSIVVKRSHGGITSEIRIDCPNAAMWWDIRDDVRICGRCASLHDDAPLVGWHPIDFARRFEPVGILSPQFRYYDPMMKKLVWYSPDSNTLKYYSLPNVLYLQFYCNYKPKK